MYTVLANLVNLSSWSEEIEWSAVFGANTSEYWGFLFSN